jgi:hypothetical protein
VATPTAIAATSGLSPSKVHRARPPAGPVPARQDGGASAVDTPPGPAQFEVGKVNAAVEVLVWGQRVVTTFARV